MDDTPKKEKKLKVAPTRKIPVGIVTRDSNNAAEIPLELSREYVTPAELEDSTTSGFIDINDELVTPSTEYGLSREFSRSRTIDASILPPDRFKKSPKRTKSKTILTIDTAERFEADVTTGLSQEQVDSRVENGYINFTKKKSSKSIGSIFFQNLVTPINGIAAAVAAALLVFNADVLQLFFMLIILVNTTIGIIQEIRAKIVVDRLSIMTAPTAIVVRDGEKRTIPTKEVVLDDIMYIEAGKQICADCIILEGEAEANESMLTGESVPMRKAKGDGLFSGSFLSSGACYARVNKIGSANYVETLTSHAKKYKKPKSELFRSINTIMKVVIPAAIVLSLITILVFYFTATVPAIEHWNANALNGYYGGYLISELIWASWQDNINAATGVMIGMLPVGMFLLTSTALVVSVIRLGKRRALVKDFNSIEMLARVNVLCLDKTGTITDGTMNVKDVVEIKGAAEMPYALSDIVGSVLTATGDNNQTARALAQKFGYSKALVPTAVLPFSSVRKFAAVSFSEAGTFIYGAPEFVLKDMGVRIEKLINEYAREGYRVLVMAHSPGNIVGEKLPTVRRPLCLFVIEDFIREDAKETIKWFKDNDVKVKVISGDNPITVSEVAKRVGIDNAELYISLEGLSERDVLEAATKYTVFGRVSPEQKQLLVRALKQKDSKVAMTGDGVNDILAMRESDCAIAIASGSEAARNVAHLVLQDSNFSSMPQVVMEGRRVVNNIQKTSSLFLMKTIMTFILSIIFLFLGHEYPYRTDFLLLMEIFVIAVASFALALQGNTSLIKGKFLSNVIGRSAPGGITLAVSMLSIYFFGQQYFYNPESAYIHLQSANLNNPAYVTMLILGVTFTSFIVLIKICEPPNLFRIVMLVSIGTALGIVTMVMSRFTPFTELFNIYLAHEYFTLTAVLYLVVTVLGSYFFMAILIRIMRALKVLSY